MSLWHEALLSFRDPASLARRAALSGVWRLGGDGVSIAMRLGSNLVMTRLLAPEAFGLMALIYVAHAGLVMVSDIGVRQCVVRSEHGGSVRFLRTAWTIQIVQYALLTLALLALSGALHVAQTTFAVDFGDTVYADPQLPALLAASSVFFMAQGLRSTTLPLAERNFALPRVTAIELLAQIAGAATMIGSALLEPSVWAILHGVTAWSIVSMVLSHVMLPGPRMGMVWDRAHAAEIWGFGKWLIGASAFGFVAANADRLLLGALMDPTAFGLYSIAVIWVFAGRDVIMRVATPTALAVFSEARREATVRLGRIVARFRLVMDAACGAAFAVVIVFGEPLIRLLYPTEYHGAADLMTLLSFLLLMQRYTPFIGLLLSCGDSRSVAPATLAAAIGILCATPAAFLLLGPEWAVLAVALNAAWSAPILLARAARHVDLRLGHELVQLAVIIVGACAYLALRP